MSFSSTSFSKTESTNNNQIIDILDTLYWEKAYDFKRQEYITFNIDKYDYHINTVRTLEEALEDTLYCNAGEEYSITYSIDFETGYVTMSPPFLSSNINDLYSILTQPQINSIKSFINDECYALDDVLNVNVDQIENISCFYTKNIWDSISYPMQLDIKETMCALDVKYNKIDIISADAINNKQVFMIKINNEFIQIYWDNNNRIYFKIDDKYYLSKETINLYDYITNTRLNSLIIINPTLYNNVMNGYKGKYQIELSTYKTYIMGFYNNAIVMFISN